MTQSKFEKNRALLLLLAIIFVVFFALYHFEKVPYQSPVNRRGIVITRCSKIFDTPVVESGVLQLPTSASGVPKLLHFMYRVSDVIKKYKGGLESCTRLNDDWRFVFWTEADVLRFVLDEYPDYFGTFVSYPQRLQRFDIARYLILHRYGGVYLDLDMVCRKPLLPTLQNISCFLDCERYEQTQYLYDREFMAMNSAMGCQPRHPFFLKLVHKTLKLDAAGKRSILSNDIVKTSGPKMLTSQYIEYSKNASQPPITLLSPKYFSPKLDEGLHLFSHCRKVLEAKSNATISKWKLKACQSLRRLGYKKGEDVYVTEDTVAIHSFMHLGYSVQTSPTFDIASFRPRMMFYRNLTAAGW